MKCGCYELSYEFIENWKLGEPDENAWNMIIKISPQNTKYHHVILSI